MQLNNKTILIVSTEDWGEMFLSKHHYAIELGKRGNKVFFINCPDRDRVLRRGKIKIVPTKHENINVVQHRLFFPYFFKYDYPGLYSFLIWFHIKRILNKIDIKPDIVWSFDLSNAIPLNRFPQACLKIFMPVDAPFHNYSIKAAKGADIIFSVTNEILHNYDAFRVPKHFLNHGVAEYFINNAVDPQSNKPIRIGYSGGLLRPEIDWETFFSIIRNNTDKIFEFWGEYDFESAFITKARNKDDTIIKYIETLKSFPNVKLHGVLSPISLFNELKKMDALIICYDIKKDQSHGTNYHKILEYLGTGKVIISNNVSTYWKNYPGLIQMIASRDNNKELLALFSSVMQDLSMHNSREKQEERINFAKQFIYANQVNKIQDILKSHDLHLSV